MITIVILFCRQSRTAIPEFENQTNPEPIDIVQQSVNEVIVRKNTNKFFLGFYFVKKDLFERQHTDWRLDIWSDLIIDKLIKTNYLWAFNEIFEIMKDPNAPEDLVEMV